MRGGLAFASQSKEEFYPFYHCRKELDSELLEAKSTVKGVLTADGDGLVLKGKQDLIMMAT